MILTENNMEKWNMGEKSGKKGNFHTLVEENTFIKFTDISFTTVEIPVILTKNNNLVSTYA